MTQESLFSHQPSDEFTLLGEERKATAADLRAKSSASACNIKDVTRNRHGGNAESEAANERVIDHKEAQRWHIYHHLKTNGPQTSKEIRRDFPMNYTSVSARLSELKRDGWIESTGERREGAAVVRVK
jgi:predicted HTH transcriptional regulator